MKILFICNKSPYPPNEGGPIAMNMFIEGLADNGHQLKVLTVSSDKYKVDIDTIPPDYKTKTKIESVYLNLNFKLWDAFNCFLKNESYHIYRFKSKEFEQKLSQILKEDNYDIIQFESLFVAPYLSMVKKLSNAKTVLRTHNVENIIWKNIAKTEKNPLKKIYLKHLSKTLEKYELGILQRFDGIISITEKDQKYFQDQGILAPIKTIPFGIDIEKYQIRINISNLNKIFHLGSMNWIPNIQGIDWFLENVWKDISTEENNITLHLAGSNMPDHIHQLIDPSIHVEGYIDNPIDYMNSHSIMIVPIFAGSGIRIKILEGMALGKTIISTTKGAAGIQYTHDKNILIADTPKQFKEAIHKCVSNQDYCEQIGQNARKLIETKYNKTDLLKNLEVFLQQL